jgi:hypothetical protein
MASGTRSVDPAIDRVENAFLDQPGDRHSHGRGLNPENLPGRDQIGRWLPFVIRHTHERKDELFGCHFCRA